MYNRTMGSEPTKQEDGWVLVENHLPPSNMTVEVIGRNYSTTDLFVGTAKFDPTRGWDGMSRVVAWKTPSSTLQKMQKAYPSRRFV